ncbi:MAG: alpha/beta hydrolase [Trueperaceae bacterium]
MVVTSVLPTPFLRVRRGTGRAPRAAIAGGPFVALAIFLCVLAAIPPLITNPMVDGHVAFDRVWAADDHAMTAERVTLTTSDGIDVVAHLVPVEAPKAVAVFLSGIHRPSVTAFFGHAAMLREQGYAALLVEMRAHGESGGTRIALGFEEPRDVQAAVAYLRAHPDYREAPIVAFGLSLGGATAINAAGLTPDIAAIVSLSAFSSWDEVFVDNMGAPEPLATLQRAFVRLYTGLKYGFDLRHVVPKRQIANLGDRPALLMHSRGDTQIPFASFERLVAAAPPHVETWVRDGDLHLIVEDGAFLRPLEDPAYAVRVIAFLEAHFGR